MNLERILIILLLALVSISFVFANDFELRVEIDHNFDENETVDCKLKHDSASDTYTFDEDSDSKDLELEEQFDDDLRLTCDSKVDEVILTILDDDNDEIYDERFTDVDEVYYELQVYTFQIDVKHNFNDEDISCDLVKDDKDDVTYDYNVSSNDFDVEGFFIDELEFSCDIEAEGLELKVYDEDEDLIFETNNEDSDEVTYKINREQEIYELFIQLTREFDEDEEIDCEIKLDDTNEAIFLFDDSSKVSDLRIENLRFAENLALSCEKNFAEIFVEVDEVELTDDTVFSKTYSNRDGFSIGISDFKFEEKKEEIIVEEPEVEVAQMPEVVVEEPQEEEVSGSAQDESTLNGQGEINMSTQLGEQNISMNETVQDEPSEPLLDSKALGIIALILVILFLGIAGLIAVKALRK